MQLYIGIMSGTSLDGLDVALVRLDATQIHLIDGIYLPLPAILRQELLELCSPTHNELYRLSIAEQHWARLAADAALSLIQRQNLCAKDIVAIGSHGQTIRHHPEQGFSVQIGSPALLTELTGIRVVSHFRQRDIAAGGQGAPLVPAFHDWLFRQHGKAAAIVNIGGFSNITFLMQQQNTQGFDCGPGNILLDAWIQKNLGKPYDEQGAWAASGQPCQDLLDKMLNASFFSIKGPKSTGRELFNLPWLEQQLDGFSHLSAQNIQSTLVELTASCIATAITQHHAPIEQLWVCGGGTHNLYLLQRMQKHLTGVQVGITDELGISADWMEAMAFAWLAHCCINSIPANRPEVTGAHGTRILGAIYPA